MVRKREIPPLAGTFVQSLHVMWVSDVAYEQFDCRVRGPSPWH